MLHENRARGMLGKIQRCATRATKVNIGPRFTDECRLLSEHLMELLVECGWAEFTDTPAPQDKHVMALIDKNIRAILAERFSPVYGRCDEQGVVDCIHEVAAVLSYVGSGKVPAEVLEVHAFATCQVIVRVLQPFANDYSRFVQRNPAAVRTRPPPLLKVYPGGKT